MEVGKKVRSEDITSTEENLKQFSALGSNTGELLMITSSAYYLQDTAVAISTKHLFQE